MNARQQDPRRRRVVLLSRDAQALAEAIGRVDADVDLVCLSQPTLAAAEMVTLGAGLLVIDLRLMGLRTLPLLDVARREGIEMVATGPLPMGLAAEQLSGVRLVGREDLAEALRKLAPPRPRPQPKPPAEPKSRPVSAASEPASEPAGPLAMEAPILFGGFDPHEAGPSAAPWAEDGDERRPAGAEICDDADLPDRLQQSGGGTEDAASVRPESLLTAEELAALLGD